MNSLSGTIRLISEDFMYTYGRIMFLYIIIPLMIVWLLIANIFGLSEEVYAAISGPAYFFIAFMGIGGYKGLYPIAIGFGSTRKQFLKVFTGVSILTVVVSFLFLNILQFILKTVFSYMDIGANILHPGILIVNEYHFLSYFWVDLMIGLFLSGMPFLIYSIVFRLGMRKSTIILMVLLIIMMFLHYGGFMSSTAQWFTSLDFERLGMTLITLLGLSGVIAFLLTYPIMKNASLKPKAKKE